MKKLLFCAVLGLPLFSSTSLPTPDVLVPPLVEVSVDDGLTWTVAAAGEDVVGEILIGADTISTDWVGIVANDGTETLFRVDAWSLTPVDRDFFYGNYGDGNAYTMVWDGLSHFVAIQ